MKILISGEAKKLMCGKRNAKDYPHWDKLLELLKDHEIKKIEGRHSVQEMVDMVNWCDVWISIDSFLPHMVKYYGLKRGIVLWSKSDPLIFGYPENINLLKDKRKLRPDQFRWWEDVEYDESAFVQPEEIQSIINNFS